jgi:hypothetical protein
MNKRTVPSTSTSSPSSRIKLALRRASVRELTHADLRSIAAGTISRNGGDDSCFPEMRNE